MKTSRSALVSVGLTVLLSAGCSDDTTDDSPTGVPNHQLSAAATIVPGVTGGGSFTCRDGEGSDVVVTHGFNLRCEGSPNRLQLNWNGNRFFLESLEDRECDEDEEEGDIEFEIEIDGTGRYNGESGAVICASFADSGEPGTGEDEVDLVLLEEGGECHHGGDEVEFEGDVILECEEELLDSGNHDGHF